MPMLATVVLVVKVVVLGLVLAVLLVYGSVAGDNDSTGSGAGACDRDWLIEESFTPGINIV